MLGVGAIPSVFLVALVVLLACSHVQKSHTPKPIKEN